MVKQGDGVWSKRDAIHPKYFHIYISVIQFFFLCTSCGSDNITKRNNKNSSKELSVCLIQLYYNFKALHLYYNYILSIKCLNLVKIAFPLFRQHLPFFFLCTSCGSDNITNRNNKNSSKELSVCLRQLYYNFKALHLYYNYILPT